LQFQENLRSTSRQNCVEELLENHGDCPHAPKMSKQKAYCYFNENQDLKDFYCGGNTCTEEELKNAACHYHVYGQYENRNVWCNSELQASAPETKGTCQVPTPLPLPPQVDTPE
jgi:hypothetical protein